MNKKSKIFLCFLICAVLLLVSNHRNNFASAEVISGTDYKDFSPYTITHQEFTLSIKHAYFQKNITVESRPLNTFCYNKKFIFLCHTSDMVYSLYLYNEVTDTLKYFVTDFPADTSSPVFSADTAGNVYIVDKHNKSLINICTSDFQTYSISCPSSVYQILCTGYNKPIVFSSKGVYELSPEGVELISTLSPATPCVYSADGIITDATGNLYTYKDGTFDICIPQTTVNHQNPADEIIVTPQYITIPQGFTFARLYKALGVNKDRITVTNNNNEIITSGKLGTGMKAEYNNITRTLIILGDLTGEGNINNSDRKALMKHLSGKELLREPFLVSANVYEDASVNTKDLLYLSNMY